MCYLRKPRNTIFFLGTRPEEPVTKATGQCLIVQEFYALFLARTGAGSDVYDISITLHTLFSVASMYHANLPSGPGLHMT